jgi:hypothetical protein
MTESGPYHSVWVFHVCCEVLAVPDCDALDSEAQAKRAEHHVSNWKQENRMVRSTPANVTRID